jgi:hypothetical protein
MKFENGKKISTGYARQLAKNYKERKLIGEDSQGVWFSKENIEEILKESNVTGIRFYFGSYGTKDEHKNEPLLENYYGKTTLIMVKTSQFNIGKETIVYQDILGDIDAKPSYNNEELELKTEFNDGQICPPPPLGDIDKNDLLFGINP